MSSRVILSILSKNRLAMTRSLFASIHAQGINAQLVACIVDENIEPYFNPDQEPFDVILAKDLNIPNWEHFAFKFNIVELNTAVKPYALEYVIDHYQADTAIYFDPDIIAYRNFDHLWTLLDQFNAILVPHLLAPIDDDKQPSEIDVMRAGEYNLGFFAMASRGQWREMLQWWQRRLYTYGYIDPDKGIFVDQKWMDLLPSFYEGVHILRHPGYDVAYWDIANRDLTLDDNGQYLVNGEPLIFFHFSGFSEKDPERVSKHQNRYQLSDLNEAYRKIYLDYQQTLIDADMAGISAWPYAYGQFDNGLHIHNALRATLRHYDPDGNIWPKPFNTTTPANFFTWATTPISKQQMLSPFALILYRITPYLQQAFPDIFTPNGMRQYAQWLVGQSLAGELDDYLTDPIKARLQPTPSIANHMPKQLGETWRFRAQPRLQLFSKWFVQRLRYFLANPQELPTALRYRLQGKHRGDAIAEATTPDDLQHTRDPIQRAAPSIPVVKPAKIDIAPTGRFGVNLISYNTLTGRVITQAMHKMLLAQNIPVAVQWLDTLPRGEDVLISGLQAQGIQYDINLFIHPPQDTYIVQSLVGLKTYVGRYNIALWEWPVPTFPSKWRSYFNLFDEVWTSNQFSQIAIASQATIPVSRIDLPIIPNPVTITRTELGLPANAFIVLVAIDAENHLDRQQLHLALAAYQRAFGDSQYQNIQLVLHATNLTNPQVRALTINQLDKVSGLLLENTTHDIDAVLPHCDTYLSLNRVQGHAINIHKAMRLGRPVITTAYGGQMDFCSEHVCYLVPYTLESIGREASPYQAVDIWAAPDVQQAAELLAHCHQNLEDTDALGQRAAQYMQQRYDIAKNSKQLHQILQSIQEQLAEKNT